MVVRRRWVWVGLLVVGGCAGDGVRVGKERLHGEWVYAGRAQMLFSQVRTIYPSSTFGVVDFGKYVDEQKNLIGSQEEINLAMQDSAWRETGRGVSEGAQADFKSRLLVESIGGFVTITYLDSDPKIALAGIKSVINSYKKVYSVSDPVNTQAILKLLDHEKVTTEEKLTALDAKRRLPQTPERIQQDEAMRTELKLLLEKVNQQYKEKLQEYACAVWVNFEDDGTLVGHVRAEKRDGHWVVLDHGGESVRK